MLVNLAAAYYRGRQFSEGLEIYFEMSKHYPVVRRIQDAMQGMYGRGAEERRGREDLLITCHQRRKDHEKHLVVGCRSSQSSS